MTKRHFPFLILLVLFFGGCGISDPHFISDADTRSRVEQRFAETKKTAIQRENELFSVFQQPLRRAEKEALMFLYAYMPLSDLADYDGPFFLKHVRTSLEIRDHFPWGRQVPEEIFRHFVLPVRVNNESLDSARWVFYHELKGRLKGMNMEQAALEVNHWCHEKVNYRGTDGRTSSPMNTVKNAFGRCGEESTFTVAAMRAAGIPARQCYTPRWAHSDDNHAWVEVWVDGTWSFLGACEPEPKLNMGWFAGPSRRTMLVSTNVYGEYNGPEEKLLANRYVTRINLLPNYAPTRTVKALVTDPAGNPIEGARVEFCLYNYAEFYPLAFSLTGPDGTARFTTGLGDLVVWARKGGLFGFMKLDVRANDSLRIVLDPQAAPINQDMDLVPPSEGKVENPATEAEQTENQDRLHAEDSIRNAYVATFMDSLSAVRLAAQTGLDPKRLWPIMRTSRGNWLAIKIFCEGLEPIEKEWAIPYLESLTEKDLHDVQASVLTGHLREAMGLTPTVKPGDADYARYVLSPRIGLEYLRPFRSEIRDAIKKAPLANPLDINQIMKWVREHIQVSDSANSYRAPISPGGVCALGWADPGSRDVFFVAVCRTLGLPARLEPASGKPQHWNQGQWETLSFDLDKPVGPGGRITLENPAAQKGFSPAYYAHFAVARLEDGFYNSLDYETDPVMTHFPATIPVESGRYRFITGNRLSDGTVLARLSFFDLPPAGSHSLAIALREPENGRSSLGRLDKSLEIKTGARSVALGDLLSDSPIAFLWLEPGKEPTRHVIAEIGDLKAEFDKAGARFIVLVPPEGSSDFERSHQSLFPAGTIFSREKNLGFLEITEKKVKRSHEGKFPVLVLVKPGGDVWYFSAGYTIGAGRALLKLFQ